MSSSQSNERKGLLIDYQYCTGCHSCEVACQKEHGLGIGEFGITVMKDGPRKLPNGRWEYRYIPAPTLLCDLCEKRVSAGKKPTCVHHCQSQCMAYGTVDELAEILKTKPQQMMYVPQ